MPHSERSLAYKGGLLVAGVLTLALTHRFLGGTGVARLPILDEVAAKLALRLFAKVYWLAGLLAVQLPAQVELPAARSRTDIGTWNSVRHVPHAPWLPIAEGDVSTCIAMKLVTPVHRLPWSLLS